MTPGLSQARPCRWMANLGITHPTVLNGIVFPKHFLELKSAPYQPSILAMDRSMIFILLDIFLIE